MHIEIIEPTDEQKNDARIFSTFFRFCDHHDVDSLDSYLRTGRDVNVGLCFTILHFPAALDLIECFLKNGADPNAHTEFIVSIEVLNSSKFNSDYESISGTPVELLAKTYYEFHLDSIQILCKYGLTILPSFLNDEIFNDENFGTYANYVKDFLNFVLICDRISISRLSIIEAYQPDVRKLILDGLITKKEDYLEVIKLITKKPNSKV
jgi:hypothetical protein